MPALALLLAGCAAGPEFAPVDLAAPGWRVWEGQASWQTDASAPPIAGDIIVAHGDADNIYVAMSKTGVPVFTAQADADGWMLEIIPTDVDRAGRGDPPQRFAWFLVPGLLADPQKTVPDWTVERPAPEQLVLLHPDSGERLHLFLDSAPR